MIPNNNDMLKKLSKHATIAGIVMMITGAAALFWPMYASLFTVGFVAWLMVFSGVSAGYFTYMTNKGDWLGWLKSVILIATGLFMLFYPMPGIAAIGMLFAIYFLIDGFSGIALAGSMRPAKGWWMWLINGLLSIALAIIFLMSWTSLKETAWLIGVFVGISLLFDGFTLLFMGSVFKNMDKE